MNEIEILNRIRYNELPRHFYKYTRINYRLIKVLEKNEFYLQSPNQFNDPFDCKAHINYGNSKEELLENAQLFTSDLGHKLQELYMQSVTELLADSELFNSLHTNAMHKCFDKLGITCFTEDGNNNLMWSHYADSHKGLVLKFRKHSKGKIPLHLHRVTYSENYPIINISTCKNVMLAPLEMMCTKGKVWLYEKELRLIFSESKFKFRKIELAEIIFGLRTSSYHKKKIYQTIKNANYPNVRFMQAFLSPGKFELQYINYP